MTQDLADWRRPHYAPGARPLLFYAVVGAPANGLELSRKRHRCDGVPAGITLSGYDATQHGEWLDSLRSGFAWDELVRDDPVLARRIAGAETCVVLRGEPADDSTLNYLRDAIGVVQAMVEGGAVAVHDPQRLRWWSALEWRARLFEPASLQPHEHVVILASPMDDGTQWFHTRGMRQFGRPDLSMHGVLPAQHDAVIEMFNRFIEMQAGGALVAEGQAIALPGLPDGLACRHRGSVDDLDFNNVHLAIERGAG